MVPKDYATKVAKKLKNPLLRITLYSLLIKMLYYFLVSLLFLTQLSIPIEQDRVTSFEPYLDQNEVLGVRVNPEFKNGLSEVVAPKKISESVGIHTTAKAAVVIDQKSGKVLFQKDAERQLPIASITKLMTALVFLEHNPGFDQIGKIGKGENSLEGARLFVRDNEEVRVEDLFYSSLVGSANNATQALVHATGLTGEKFREEMNKKAVSLGMINTHFEEPTGLSKNNISTASDLIKLASGAFNIPKIKEATTLKEYPLTTVSSQEYHLVKSQDELLDSFLSLTGAKTGFTNEAGYCQIAQAKNDSSNEIIAVVLGSESSSARFQELKALVAWALENYQW